MIYRNGKKRVGLRPVLFIFVLLQPAGAEKKSEGERLCQWRLPRIYRKISGILRRFFLTAQILKSGK